MRQYWTSPLPPFHTADGGGAVGTAALTDVSPAPSIIIPANMLEVGSRLEIDLFGRYTTAATPGSASTGWYIGSGAIGSAAAVVVTASNALGASVTNRSFRMQGSASVRTVGTTGTIIGLTETISVPTVNAIEIAPATAPTAVTLDTTVANKVMFGVTPTLTTSSWTIHYMTVRLLN
jgi:hypothetical protein